MKKTTQRSYRKLPGNRSVAATVQTGKGKRKTVIKTSLVNTDYGRQKTSAQGYKTKVKYNKSGDVKSVKTKKLGGLRALSL